LLNIQIAAGRPVAPEHLDEQVARLELEALHRQADVGGERGADDDAALEHEVAAADAARQLAGEAVLAALAEREGLDRGRQPGDAAEVDVERVGAAGSQELGLEAAPDEQVGGGASSGGWWRRYWGHGRRV
jgi:hypothetical protein